MTAKLSVDLAEAEELLLRFALRANGLDGCPFALANIGSAT
jgi:hypothetical protein